MPDSIPITLHSRVTVELVDSTGEVERYEFMLVSAKQAGSLFWQLTPGRERDKI